MKIKKTKRKFRPIKNSELEITDCGKIYLDDNEQVTFGFNKKSYDFCQTNWGFYVTSSINSRLKKEGFKVGLFKNKNQRRYVYAIDNKKIKIFKLFLKKTNHTLVSWL